MKPLSVFVFCLSYVDVPYVLSLVRDSSISVTVVVSGPELYRFFTNYVKEAECMFLISVQKGARAPIAQGKLVTRDSLHEIIENRRARKIVFCDFCFCAEELRVFKEIDSRIDRYFSPSIDTDLKYRLSASPLAWARAVRMWLATTVWQLPRVSGARLYFQVCDKALYALPRFIPRDHRRVLGFDAMDCGGDVLWLAGGIVSEGMVLDADYVHGCDQILNFFESEMAFTINLKVHPRYQDKHGLEHRFSELPSDIPASLLLCSHKLVIGYSSTALCEAANCGKIAISLINILRSSDPARTDNFKNYLVANTNGEIYFPKTLMELQCLVYQKAYASKN